jgi:hypothetical protein
MQYFSRKLLNRYAPVPPDELLQLLIDVFAVMDDAMACNVREVEREVLLPKVTVHLSVHSP